MKPGPTSTRDAMVDAMTWSPAAADAAHVAGPWPGARSPQVAPTPPLLAGARTSPTIDVAAALRGKNILLIGTTGFVGKVALSMLLCHYPDVARVYCLVRPGSGNTADERFYRKVATSEAFRPLKDRHGAGYEAFLRSKIVAIAGDIGRPLCNFDQAQFDAFQADGGLHVILNSAGLVSFQPTLESALRINALGAKNVLDTARKAGARLCHVSTCYVAGEREGEVWEDEPLVGYFPRRDELHDRDFDAAAEAADCQRILDQVKERSNDRAHISEFRERAVASLKAQGRDPDDEDVLKLAVARERKIWSAEQLTKLGMERATHWGWTNTYTYTKSLGEQLIMADPSVVSTIVRPAIVESAVRFPMAGWNEGFNTTAPIVYLVYKGHRTVPAGENTALDVIPVDFIAAGMWLATAAVLLGEHDPVYQLGSSDSNRVTAKRLMELTALAVRGHFKDKADRGEDELASRLRARLEAMPTSFEQFNRLSAPMVKRVADGIVRTIDERLPSWGAPRLEAWAERARDELGKISAFTGQVIDLVELFKPFNYDRDITFKCDNIRALWARVTPEDQERLLWAPHLMDWRHYWLETHFEGLRTHVFKQLDEEFGAKPKSVYTYKDLVELFEATTKAHKHRVAFRLHPTAGTDDRTAPVIETYTYKRVGELARAGAAGLLARGVVGGTGTGSVADRVMVMSENRPEWPITYFSILLAGATAVPLDSGLAPAELANLIRTSTPKVLVVSQRIAERLCADAGVALPLPAQDDDGRAAHRGLAGWLDREVAPALAPHGLSVPVVLDFDEHLAGPPAGAPTSVPRAKLGADAVASIIFTSGTTGTPKGVMLTHKNFTSMAAKLSSLFQLYKHDRLLSVLPLHHTFEFSAGLLMPLVHGACIDYLEEIDADSLAAALEHEGITGMVGVPALWQLLERKIYKNLADRGVLVERAFDAIVDVNRKLRDALAWDIGLGKVLFYPVHRKLGGRMRLLISGGSALPADTMEAFHGLGFNLFEGYGMTESSPVLTVTRPGDKVIAGSVGRPLPGTEVKLDAPDERGVGEVIAKGPSVMAGYYANPEATAATLQDGWLHTGDLGRFDADGNLFIVGRKKEMILGASGENVYPDELEELYRDSKFIKELSVVGLPTAGAGETVAMLVVPDYEYGKDHGDLEREQVRDEVRAHIAKVSRGLPLYKRAKVVHLWDRDLPKTSTRKPKRREIVKELERLERAAKGGAEAKRLAGEAAAAGTVASSTAWVVDLIVEVAQKQGTAVTGETRLEDLGYDSLMFTELGVALEGAGVELPDPSELLGLATIGDVEALVGRQGAKARSERPARERKQRDEAKAKRSDRAQGDGEDIEVPAPLVRIGRRALAAGMKAMYERLLDTTVHGKAYIPPFGGYIVAANHASHLDTGLVKYALGEQGDAMVALAAKDYFFDDPVRRMYFENFTNLVPMERHGSLRESLRLAGDVLRQGYVLLIFPEGTRSDTGVMTDFKPSLGYLAMSNRCGILPMYLGGTQAAMPKGKMLPRRADVSAHVGPFMSYEQVAALAAGRSRSEGYKQVAWHVEGVIRKLAPKDQAWTLGDAGLTPKAQWAAERGITLGGAEGEEASS